MFYCRLYVMFYCRRYVMFYVLCFYVLCIKDFMFYVFMFLGFSRSNAGRLAPTTSRGRSECVLPSLRLRQRLACDSLSRLGRSKARCVSLRLRQRLACSSLLLVPCTLKSSRLLARLSQHQRRTLSRDYPCLEKFPRWGCGRLACSVLCRSV